MSGAILAQAALDGSTVLRFVQTSACSRASCPTACSSSSPSPTRSGPPHRRARGAGAADQRRRGDQPRRCRVHRQDRHADQRTARLGGGRARRGRRGGGARALLGTFARSVASTNATTTALAADTSLRGQPADVVDEVEFRSSLRWSGITLADGTALVLGAPSTVRPALADAAVVSEDALRRRTGEGLRVLVLRAGRARSTTPRDGPGCRACARSRSSRWPTSCARASPTSSPASPRGGRGQGRLRRRPRHRRRPRRPARGSTRPRWPGRRSPGSRAPTPTPSTRPSTPTGLRADRPGAEGADRRVPGPPAGTRWRWWATASTTPAHSSARRSGWRCARAAAVTRDVADIVLLDDSFATLPPARTEGRRIIAGVGSSMYLFLSRVATQILVILTVTLLGLGFPYTPTQVGLTLFTVGVPTFFLTLWARRNRPTTTCWRRWRGSSSRWACSPPASPPRSTPTSTARSPTASPARPIRRRSPCSSSTPG